MNILIVDDHEENLYLLEALFKGNGYTVQPAANGAEGLAILEKGGIDLIVSDILMPEMDGFELCRRVRKAPTLSRIPFIIYTATYTGPKDEELALKIGADRFIVKPCEPKKFMAAVDALIAAAEHRNGSTTPDAAPDEEIFKLYNARLVRKLEQKMLQAEREIQARQEMEQSLRESEEKYRTILDNMEAGYFEVDLAGNLTFFNPAARRILGYPESKLMGMNNRDYMDPKNAKRVFRTFNRVLSSGEPAKAFDWQIIKKDGTLADIETSVALMRDAKGRAVGFRGLARDVTERRQSEAERKKLQAQLLQAQKLESVGRLAGGVAHDFNNMLSVIIGHTELALQQLDSQHPLQSDLAEVLAAAQRSTSITRQLLAFARQQVIAPEVLDLNAAVENMLKMLRRLIGEDINLVWQPGAKLWPIQMDPSQLDQILANLCVNARDAIADVGQLTIETRAVTIDEAYCVDHAECLPGNYVMLAVSDNGRGMERETLEKIFDPFFTTKEIGCGTGLGLATVYGIVRQNDGFINVYSEPGRDTSFRIYLPGHAGAVANERKPETALIAKGRGETVLVVEDEIAILQLIKRILSGLDYSVLDALTPDRALELAEAHADQIDLLITDVVMPGMNGHDLAERFQAQYPDLKVLFISGYTADAIALRGVLDGSVHFLQKPFSRIDLAASVRSALDDPCGILPG